jgi:hypothetical protein
VIDAAISHLAQQLNEYLRRRHGLDDDIVAVSNIVEPGGTAAPHTVNRLVICLANIEKDSMAQQGLPHPAMQAGRLAVYGKPLFLNLYVVVAATFGDKHYPEALVFLSSAIEFFQRHPVFDRQSTPGLDGRIEKLLVDIENLDTAALSNLWGMMGGRYLPSVYYKVRMVGMGGAELTGQASSVAQLDSSVGGG